MSAHLDGAGAAGTPSFHTVVILCVTASLAVNEMRRRVARTTDVAPEGVMLRLDIAPSAGLTIKMLVVGTEPFKTSVAEPQRRRHQPACIAALLDPAVDDTRFRRAPWSKESATLSTDQQPPRITLQFFRIVEASSELQADSNWRSSHRNMRLIH
jgi:hypothetical protein